jgi:hypothetical protein
MLKLFLAVKRTSLLYYSTGPDTVVNFLCRYDIVPIDTQHAQHKNIFYSYTIMVNVIIQNAILQNVILLNIILLNVILLNVILLNAILLNVILLNAILLSVILPNVVAPFSWHRGWTH